MTSAPGDDKLPFVWCPIIPTNRIEELEGYDEELEKLAEVYYDWVASMRAKSVIGGEVGVYLDRIRILMINIGVASGRNRDFAETVQTIISETLREQIMKSVNAMGTDTPQKRSLKQTMSDFFSCVRFTRDIDPVEEITKCASGAFSVSPSRLMGSVRKLVTSREESDSGGDDAFIRTAMVEATRIMLRVYVRLLSPDPWGNSKR